MSRYEDPKVIFRGWSDRVFREFAESTAEARARADAEFEGAFSRWLSEADPESYTLYKLDPIRWGRKVMAEARRRGREERRRLRARSR